MNFWKERPKHVRLELLAKFPAQKPEIADNKYAAN